jgi:hypothetical protein
MLRLATYGFGVEYKAFFNAFLDRVKDIVDLGFILDPLEKKIVHPALDWIRSFGWHIPMVAPHWRSVFVLLWLFMITAAKNLPGPLFLLDNLRDNIESLGRGSQSRIKMPHHLRARNIIVAGACALVGAVATGTVAKDSLEILTWPLASFFLYGVVTEFMTGIVGHSNFRGFFRMGALTLITILAGFLFGPALGLMNLDIESPGLLILVSLVGAMGLIFLVLGLFSIGSLQERLKDQYMVAGADILAVLGTAAAIAYIMQV